MRKRGQRTYKELVSLRVVVLISFYMVTGSLGMHYYALDVKHCRMVIQEYLCGSFAFASIPKWRSLPRVAVPNDMLLISQI